MNYRHGDISLHRVRLAKGEKVTHKGSFVLAEGEMTGHKHVITTARPEDLEIRQDKEGRYFFTIKSEATITHEEHKTLRVAPGIYEMHNEREFDWFQMTTRRVLD